MRLVIEALAETWLWLFFFAAAVLTMSWFKECLPGLLRRAALFFRRCGTMKRYRD